MTQPSVLHVSTWKTPCGIAGYCGDLVNALDKRGIRNDVFAIDSVGWKDFLPSDVSAWENDIMEKAKQVDLVHIQHEHSFFGYALGGGFATKRFTSVVRRLNAMKKPVVTTFHTDINTNAGSTGWKGKFDLWRRRRRWHKVASCFTGKPQQSTAIVHNNSTRKSFVKHGFNQTALNVMSVPCLPPRNITLDQTESKIQLGLQPEDRLLTIFGFIGEYKGHELALDTLEHLPENYHLAFVGGMHPENNSGFLEHLLRKRNDIDPARIRITGWVDRATADRYFAAADVCLAPYMSNALLSGSAAITWALSSGRPVIASKIEAFKSVNRQCDAMFMVTPDRPRELAWAVEKVVSDPILATRLVQSANKFCLSHSWDQACNKIVSIYQTMAPSTAWPNPVEGEDAKIYPLRASA